MDNLKSLSPEQLKKLWESIRPKTSMFNVDKFRFYGTK